MTPIRAVVFDVDGLLLDSESIYRSSWQTSARRQGVEIDDATYRGFVGQRIAWCESQVAALSPQFDLPAFQTAWRENWRETARRGVQPKPGAMDLLTHLRAHHIPCGVATSSALAEATLSLGPLMDRFQAVVTGDQVSRGKPAPDIYLEAARRLGVPAGACLALEDSDNGARSALAAGMSVLVVPDLVEPSAAVREQARAVHASLIEARAMVCDLLGIPAHGGPALQTPG